MEFAQLNMHKAAHTYLVRDVMLFLHFCFLPDEFKSIYSATEVHKQIPFNFDCRFVCLHFGQDKKKELSYDEFTQFLQVGFQVS